jgi:hypothetical protein
MVKNTDCDIVMESGDRVPYICGAVAYFSDRHVKADIKNPGTHKWHHFDAYGLGARVTQHQMYCRQAHAALRIMPEIRQFSYAEQLQTAVFLVRSDVYHRNVQ